MSASPGRIETWPLEVEAINEGGALKPEKPLPLGERGRVTVTVRPHEGLIRRSAGLIPRPGVA